jgi:hypothetical protein
MFHISNRNETLSAQRASAALRLSSYAVMPVVLVVVVLPSLPAAA